MQERYLSSVGNTELLQIQTLQDKFDSALGRESNAPGKFENYNPVLARWGFDRLATPEQRQLFRTNEFQNVTTALRERNHTTESRLGLTIGPDRKIHNEVFPDDSYQKVLERGLRYRAENGSQEIDREIAEVNGFLQIQEVLTDVKTPIGTKFIVVSPPGIVEDSAYTHNFVDFYELALDKETGEKYIEYTRFASPLDYDQYHEIVESLDRHYFKEMEGPIDAWYLGNPIPVFTDEPDGQKTVDEFFEQHFAKDRRAMEEEQFQELYKTYLPYILYYLDQLTTDEFDPIKVAEAYNALLLSTENDEMKEETTVFLANNQSIDSIVYKYGREAVEEKKAGCGTSGGFTFGGTGIFGANSVSKYGGGGGSKEWFNCPRCSYKASGPVGDTCPGCQITKDEYAKDKSASEVC